MVHWHSSKVRLEFVIFNIGHDSVTGFLYLPLCHGWKLRFVTKKTGDRRSSELYQLKVLSVS